ncbi:hypothetical protein [Iningainema tapete]|uniref:Uncharacterized protein n=1 Tax=Iningainema tapete BLCC-T55 TaxID=2748662 RepID=A0A8J6XPN2_9CYAN|nr:hypothetical protein [Iningainema tapete]MBD2776981.1 hypothetical protein [Iningainema tapete BLCC-T55]
MRHPFDLEISNLEIVLNFEEITDEQANKVVGGESVYTTLAVGEEGGDATTLALGEEGGYKTTLALGEEGGDFTTRSLREEGGWATTYAVGEEGGGLLY